MIILEEKQILELHEMMIIKTGGMKGIRDINLLSSAIYSPFQTFDTIDVYPTIEEKAASLAFGIIKNHPFVDGNKRTGLFVMLVFLELNKTNLKFSQKELINLGLGIADGNLNISDIINFITKHKQ